MSEAIIAAQTPVPSVTRIQAFLRTLDSALASEYFALDAQARLLKSTISLCASCLQHAPAIVFAFGGKVWMRTICAEHGATSALVENDFGFYRLSNKDRWGVRYDHERVFDIPEYSSCCGGGTCSSAASTAGSGLRATNHHDQLENKSCTVLLEVTNACNLACRVCYADAKGDRVLPLHEACAYISRLIEAKGFLDSVQVTGGEATIHPQFWEIVAWLHRQEGVGKVYLPTNGIEFSKPEVAAKLRQFKDKVLVLLQFDGATRAANTTLRRSDTRRVRERTIAGLDRLGIPMQLTMTIAQDVSEAEISWVVAQGLRHRHVRLVGMLPAFYTGRYELQTDPLRRTTLSTVVHAVARGMPRRVTQQDFVPIPCSHPNCGWTTLFARRFGLLFNITQKIDLEAVMNDVAYKTILNKDEIHSVLGGGRSSFVGRLLTRIGRQFVRPKDVFGIAVKPFMDRHTFDYDRVANCCHHVLDTRGELVSFCEYNTRLRVDDSWSDKPQLSGRHSNVARAVSESFGA